MLTPLSLAALLADPVRLQVVAAVALGATTAEQVAGTSGRSAREVGGALRRLLGSGLLVDDSGLRVDHALLRALAAPPAQDEGDPRLRPFVQGRRLRSLPASPVRRSLVLAHVATQALEPGRDYSEPEVNAALGAWCEGGEVDHAALRRYLVESGLVSRGGGVYRLGQDAPAPTEGERRVRAMGLT